MTRRLSLATLALAAVAFAHPMGNFSVSHYTRIDVRPTGAAHITYILDLAELPTFELLQKWDLKQDSPKAQIEGKAAQEAKAWVANLKFLQNGKPVQARVLDTKIVMTDGAGNLPIARITSRIEVPLTAAAGTLEFEDTNYPERAGWKEIVIGAAKGVTLIEASQIDLERSKALTDYPTDPRIAPPQDLRARLEWKTNVVAQKPAAIVQVEQPKPTPQTVGGPPTPATPGEVVKGDALSQLLSHKELSLPALLLALLVAFWLGAGHATTPGHGKTMVAAYLVGERGTPKHAMILGAVVTLTHTVSVFALGIATYFLAGSFAPETVTKFLGVLSGTSIIVIGLWLVYKRSMKLMAAPEPVPEHVHELEYAHAQAHGRSLKLVTPHHHHHGPGGHTHVPEGPLTMGSLIGLGASGGLVPCPSALVLLLSSIAIGRIGLGLALLVSFSLGLAAVLMGIGLAVLYAKHLLPKTADTIKHPLVKLIPVLSAGVVTMIGIAMTATALGWVKIAGV